MPELRRALAWWYAPHEWRADATHEDTAMVTDSPKSRLNVLLNRAAPLLADLHPLAPMLLMQAQGMLANVPDDVLVEQAHRLRDVTTYIIAGGEPPAWLP